MRKRVHYPRIVLTGVICLLLVGCAASSQALQAGNTVPPVAQITPSSASSLSAVNWANFTYSSSCYQNTQPFHTHNGQAVNGPVHFVVYAPVYGDLTGDGQPEAVVPYRCSAADAGGERVFVYSGTSSHPYLLGDLPLPDPKGAIANVTGISISNEALHLEGGGYSPTAPHCCPDLFIKTNYRWDKGKFVITQAEVRKQ